MNEAKARAFFDNAQLLRKTMGVVPLMYGSLGLEYRTGEDLHADDIDILIPEAFVTDRWPEFRALLEENGYTLTDEAEHAFEKGGVCFAYAAIEELEPFAGIAPAEVATLNAGNVPFRLLSLEQYLKVYTASSKDGYRADVRGKKDGEKIAFIKRLLQKSTIEEPR